jgi:hypothetical protein
MNTKYLISAIVVCIVLIGNVSAIGLAGSTFGKGPGTPVTGHGAVTSLPGVNAPTSNGVPFQGQGRAWYSSGVPGWFDNYGGFHPWTSETWVNTQVGGLPGIQQGSPISGATSGWTPNGGVSAARSISSNFGTIAGGSSGGTIGSGSGGIRGTSNGAGGTFGNGPF